MDQFALNQPTFADLEFQNKKRKTRREEFLEQIDSLIPWQRLEQRIRPHYPQAGGGAGLMPVGDAADSHCSGVPQPERPGYGRPRLSLGAGSAI